jgi:hypothetical protein
MNATSKFLARAIALAALSLFLAISYAAYAAAQNSKTPSGPPQSGSKVMGELKFDGVTKVEREAGVWVLLLPGEHKVAVRQSGYDDFEQKLTVEPGQVHTVVVRMHLAPHATTPDITSTLKLDIEPGRAAVFLDGKFVGHASEFGGALHSMLISPGKHRIKVELPGYRSFDTEVNLLPGQKSEVKTELVKGSIEQASPEIKQPQ